MSFLNGILLWGLAAMGIPVLLHLVRRQRHVRVRWGATHFLADVVHRRRHTIRIEQWLLVALRMLMLGAIALACARPAIRMADVAGLRGRRDVAIVVDVSYSTAYGGVAGELREAARALVDSLGDDDTLTVVAAGERPRLVFPPEGGSGHPERAAAVESLEPRAGRADFEAAVRLALRELDGKTGERELWLVTDARAIDWSRDEARSIRRALDALGPGGRVELGWSVAASSAGADTPFIESLVAPPSVTAGEEVELRVTVMGRGSGESAEFVVEVDGVVVTREELAPARGERRELVVMHVFDRPGAARIEARLTDPPGVPGVDALDALDRSWHAVAIAHSGTPILVVDGDRGATPLESETGYLVLALGADGSDAPDGTFRPEYASPAELATRALDEFACVIVADVPAIEADTAARLERRVERGGGLIIFAGDRFDPAAYRALVRDGGGLLPCSLGGPRDSDDGAGVKLGADGRRLLEGIDDRAFETVRLTRRLALDCAARAPDGASAEIILVTDDGAPLIASRRLGRGRVVFSALPCDDSWSNLPLRWVNVPLVRALVAHASFADQTPRNLETGAPLVATWREEASAGETVALRAPDGVLFTGLASRADGRLAIRYRDTFAQGIYAATLTAGEGQPGRTELFAFNVGRAESNLSPLADETVERRAAELGATVSRGPGGLRTLLAERRHGIELWRPLAALALGLAFVELFLLRRMERRSRAARAAAAIGPGGAS